MTLAKQIMDSLKQVIHALKTGGWSGMEATVTAPPPPLMLYVPDNPEYRLGSLGRDWAVEYSDPDGGYSVAYFKNQADARNYFIKLMDGKQ